MTSSCPSGPSLALLCDPTSEPLLVSALDRLCPLFPRTFVVSPDPSSLPAVDVPVVGHAVPGGNEVATVYSALLAAPTENVLCLDPSIRGVTRNLLLELARRSGRGYQVMPRRAMVPQPLCAVYSRLALHTLRESALRGGGPMLSLLSRLEVAYLDMDDRDFQDPEELFPAAAFSEAPAPRSLEGGSRRGLSDLNLRIQTFFRSSPFPVVSFVGKKKSGKTTVLLGVTSELRRRGHRVAVLKHDLHGFEMDVPGTDSYRFSEAGVEVVGISSPSRYVWLNSVGEERTLGELVRTISEPVDVVISEGFKNDDAPKIEVSRSARSAMLVSPVDELIGVASDQTFANLNVPQLALDDFVGLADLIEERIILSS